MSLPFVPHISGLFKNYEYHVQGYLGKCIIQHGNQFSFNLTFLLKRSK